MNIVIANQKGGVAKTNTCLTLGHGLALRGYNVLLIDTDPQGHLAVGLGLDKGDELVQWLKGSISLKWAAQRTGRENLDVIRSGNGTAEYIVELSSRRFREAVMDKALSIPNPYDVVLIDCAPSRSVLLDAAIMAADYLLAPARMDQLSGDGLLEILATLAEMKGFGARCELLGIIPTMYDRREAESVKQLQALVDGFGQRVWPAILTDSRVKVANREGKTLWEIQAPRSLAGYTAVIEKLQRLIK